MTRADAILAASLAVLRDAEEAAFPTSRFAAPDIDAGAELAALADRMTADAMADGADPRRVNEWMRGEEIQ